MLGHWTDLTAVAFSFTKHSEQEQDRIRIFKHAVARLVSLLNAVIFADLEGSKENATNRALNYELLDVEGLDNAALEHLQLADGQHLIPLMVFQWFHNLIVQEISTGVLSIPAPLLTRVFQAMNQAMLSYEDARKYASTPFPFPYTAAMEIVLTVHFFLTPLMVSSWELELPGVLCFNFFLVFMMWLLHLVPRDFENPFAVQLAGLDTEKLQNTMNEILVNLMTDPMDYCPRESAQVTCSMATRTS